MRGAGGGAADRTPASVVRGWLEALDRWAVRHDRIEPIGAGGFILRVKRALHKGPRVVLADGTIVAPGDLIGELHLDNERLAAIRAEQGTVRVRREFFRAVAALAVDLAERPEYREIQALRGASILWQPAVRVGFEPRAIAPFTRWWLGTWERILFAHYVPDGRRRLGKRRHPDLRELWMSRRVALRIARRSAGGEPAAGDGAPRDPAPPDPDGSG